MMGERSIQQGIADDSPPEGRAGLYRSGQKLLIVGDGDFSFSAGLARRLGSKGSAGIVATSPDTIEVRMHPPPFISPMFAPILFCLFLALLPSSPPGPTSPPPSPFSCLNIPLYRQHQSVGRSSICSSVLPILPIHSHLIRSSCLHSVQEVAHNYGAKAKFCLDQVRRSSFSSAESLGDSQRPQSASPALPSLGTQGTYSPCQNHTTGSRNTFEATHST